MLPAARQDATNTKKHEKRNVFELAAAFLHDKEPASGNVEWSQWRRLKMLGDMLPVRDGTGRGTVSQTLKHFESLGAPSWRDFDIQRGPISSYLSIFVLGKYCQTLSPGSSHNDSELAYRS